MEITIKLQDGSFETIEYGTLVQEPLNNSSVYIEGTEKKEFSTEKEGCKLQKVQGCSSVVLVGKEKSLSKIESKYCIRHDKLSENTLRVELESVSVAEEKSDSEVYIECKDGATYTLTGDLKCAYN